MPATTTLVSDLPYVGQSKHLYEVAITIGVYATNGVAIDATLNTRFTTMVLTGTGGYSFEFIPATQLLKVYRGKDTAAAGGADIPFVEVGNAVDLSAIIATGIAIGA